MHARATVRNLTAIILLALPLAGCRTVPETGRSQLHLVSDSAVEEQSALAFAQMKHDTPQSDNPEDKAMVRRAGARIVEAARRSGAPLPPAEQWEFIVFEDDKTINAFAMPGGKVGVYTGMFRVARNENDMAVVLGHEIAHVAAKHGDERVSQALLQQGGLAALGYGLSQSSASAGTQQAVLEASGAVTTVAGILPYSRLQESEADHIGLLYTARAGYDPRAAVPFWQRMDAQGGGAPPVFLSTHPPTSTRISDLQAEMPQAMAEYQKAQAAGGG